MREHLRDSTHRSRKISTMHIFYNAYLNSGAVFRSQRVCSIEAIVAAAGEHIHPYLAYLSGLIDLIGWT